MSVDTLTAPLPKPRRALASTLGFVTVVGLVFVAGFALPYFTLNGVGLGVVGGIADFNTAFGIAMWASWTVPLLVTEAILQGRKILAVRT